MIIRLNTLEVAEIIAGHMTKVLNQQVTTGQVSFMEEYADRIGSGSAVLSYVEVDIKS